MKIGDIIRWRGGPYHRSIPAKYGLIVGKDGVFFEILWQSGEMKGAFARWLEVVNAGR